MRFTDIILGLVVGISALVVCLAFVIDAYSSSNYDVDLSQDTDTLKIYELQSNTTSSYNQLHSTYSDVDCNAIGGNCSSITPGSSTDADLAKSAFSAMTSFRSILDIFDSMKNTVFNLLGLDDASKQVYLWMFGLMIAIPIIMMLLNAVLKNPVL